MIEENRKRPRIVTFLIRGLLFLFSSLIIITVLFLIYLNLKKNDISEKLLNSVNKGLKGEFSVRSISLGSLFTYPDLKVSVDELKFNAPYSQLTHGELILKIKTLQFKVDLSDVFSKKIEIVDVYIKEAQLFIERDSLENMVISEGFELLKTTTKSVDSSGLSILIKNFLIEDSEVVIIDRPTEVVLPFRLDQIKGTFQLKNNLIQGEAKVELLPLGFVETETFFINELPIQLSTEYSVNIVKKLVNVKGKELYIGDEHYSLNYHYNYTKQPHMDFQMNSLDAGIDLSTIFIQKVDTLEDNKSIQLHGQGHFKTDLHWKPDAKIPFLHALEADFTLEGRNLKIYGIDMDDVIDKFDRTQNFNLADIGAVMFAGPAGLAVTKGGDFARLAFIKAGDSTHVRHFLAEWKMEKGLLKTQDLALSTNRNLIATEGWYQVQTDSLDFTLNVLDKRGCELVGQRIYGKANAPDYEKVKFLKTFLGPVKNFFRNIGIAKCDTIYAGKVKHPEFVVTK